VALGQNLIGVGLMNIIQAYQDDEEDVVLNAANPADENDFMMEDDNLLQPYEAHLQIGMARTFFFPVKDQSALCQNFSEEGLQLWEKYFAPHIDYGLSGKKQDLQIPVSWFNFITLMLVTLERFDWIVQFLNSSLWEITKEQIQNENTIPFVIPDKFLVQQAPSCKLSLLEEIESLEGSPVKIDSPPIQPAAPQRKRKTKLPLVESEVRRSPRIVELNDGFKSHSNCNDKKCLTCNAAPPSMNNKLVKNLATSFCKVDDEVIEKKLLKKGRLADKDKVIGKHAGKGPKTVVASKGDGKA
jgi:hypothetical protein